MAIFCPLFSGSSGNCTYISSENKSIIIDAGVSCKKITDSIKEIGGDIANLSAIFITHEHIDHILGLKTISKKYNIPIYCSECTAKALKANLDSVADIYAFENSVSIDGFFIERFATSHDCDGSSGYKIHTPDGKTIAVCTDLGYVSQEVDNAINGCDLVMLESNHEVSMLQNGPYPYELKRRILSDKGHLSNTCCAEEILKLLKSGCKRFVVGHLSKDNNHPIIAAQNIETHLSLEGFVRNEDYILEIAPQSNGKVMVI